MFESIQEQKEWDDAVYKEEKARLAFYEARAIAQQAYRDWRIANSNLSELENAYEKKYGFV